MPQLELLSVQKPFSSSIHPSVFQFSMAFPIVVTGGGIDGYGAIDRSELITMVDAVLVIGRHSCGRHAAISLDREQLGPQLARRGHLSTV